MKHLVIIDGHHLMYRAYWAIPRTLKKRDEEQVNAVFGFASMILSILKTEEPTHFIICFDAGEETFRHQENATYKDGRAETPDDFYVQIPRIIECIERFGFSHVSDKKYEADDFLCTYAKAAEDAGMRVTIVTGDRDAFQLATDNVRIAIPHKAYQAAEYLGPAEIEAKYGVRPDQIVDYKGLTGDPSDNLPGVHGIGPKTAASLLQQFGTLKNLYDHLDEVKGSAKQKLEEGREHAFFCAHMAELICDIPLPLSLDQTALADFPAENAMEWFTSMEFSLLKRRFTDLLRTPFGSRIAPGFDPEAATKKAESQLSLF